MHINWKSIETAPRTAGEVENWPLLYDASRRHTGPIVQGRWLKWNALGDGGWQDRENNIVYATHWCEPEKPITEENQL